LKQPGQSDRSAHTTKTALLQFQRSLKMHSSNMRHHSGTQTPHSCPHAQYCMPLRCSKLMKPSHGRPAHDTNWQVSATMNSNSSMGDDGPVDIDALARRLSSEAERLKRSESGKEASSSSSAPESYAFSDPIFGPQVGPSTHLERTIFPGEALLTRHSSPMY